MSTEKVLATLEPGFRVIVEDMISQLEKEGIRCVAVSGRRTIHEQNELFAKGRDSEGNIIGKIVTRARGGQSPHNFGLACDVCPLDANDNLWWNAPDDVWHVIAIKAKELGLNDGYDFKSIKDSPHVESAQWKVAQALWKEGKLNVA